MNLSKQEMIALYRHLYRTESMQSPELYRFYVRLQKEVYRYLSVGEIQAIQRTGQMPKVEE